MHIFRIYAVSNIPRASKLFCKKTFSTKKNYDFSSLMINKKAFWSQALASVPYRSIFVVLYYHNLKIPSISEAALDVPPRRVARRGLNVPPQSADRRPGQQHRRPSRRHRLGGRGWRAAPRCSHHTVGEPIRRPAPSSQPQVLSQGLKGMEEDAFFPDLLPWSFHLLGKTIIERIYARTINFQIPTCSISFNAVWWHQRFILANY